MSFLDRVKKGQVGSSGTTGPIMPTGKFLKDLVSKQELEEMKDAVTQY